MAIIYSQNVRPIINPWCRISRAYPKLPIGHFRFHYHSDGLNQRWRTCPNFWHSRPIIVLTFDTLNACFHKVSTINGHGSEQTLLRISRGSKQQRPLPMSEPTVRLSYSVTVHIECQPHGDNALRNVIVHIMHAC